MHQFGNVSHLKRTPVPPSVQLDEDAGAEAQLTARLCERALHLILRRFSSSISESLWTALDGRRIRFMRNHDRLLDWGEEGLCISCEVASELGIEWDAKKDDLAAAQPELLNGFEVLLALGQFYLFSVLKQTPPRRALHDVLSLYDALSRSERLRVRQLLERPNIDSGNAFGLFLERAQSPHPDDMDGVTWRDLHITWLLGQDRLDLPYDRRAAREVLASDIDPDEKRLRLYEVLRSYDRDIEGDNIRRIAAEVRAQRQELVFGRMSRAFHNQGTLFADAALLFPDARMAELADALDKATRGSEVLQPTAETLRLLLKKGEEIALTQLEGACERFEEAVLEVQQQDTRSLSAARQRTRRKSRRRAGQHGAPHRSRRAYRPADDGASAHRGRRAPRGAGGGQAERGLRRRKPAPLSYRLASARKDQRIRGALSGQVGKSQKAGAPVGQPSVQQSRLPLARRGRPLD